MFKIEFEFRRRNQVRMQEWDSNCQLLSFNLFATISAKEITTWREFVYLQVCVCICYCWCCCCLIKSFSPVPVSFSFSVSQIYHKRTFKLICKEKISYYFSVCSFLNHKIWIKHEIRFNRESKFEKPTFHKNLSNPSLENTCSPTTTTKTHNIHILLLLLN